MSTVTPNFRCPEGYFTCMHIMIEIIEEKVLLPSPLRSDRCSEKALSRISFLRLILFCDMNQHDTLSFLKCWNERVESTLSFQ